MSVNVNKSMISCSNLSREEIRGHMELLSFQVCELDVGLKYLGLKLKPNAYCNED